MDVNIRYSRMYNIVTDKKISKAKIYQMRLNHNWNWGSLKYTNCYLFPHFRTMVFDKKWIRSYLSRSLFCLVQCYVFLFTSIFIIAICDLFLLFVESVLLFLSKIFSFSFWSPSLVIIDLSCCIFKENIGSRWKEIFRIE